MLLKCALITVEMEKTGSTLDEFVGDRMVFSSIEFLFRFLPVFLIAYFITKPQYRNVTLLIGSLFFYAYGEPVYILLMVVSIVINHIFARKIYDYHIKEAQKGWSYQYNRRRLLIMAFIFDFGMLFIFKYLDFFLRILEMLLDSKLPHYSLSLPLGISFYTFQIVSYVVDVYRKEYAAGRGLIPFATYVAMFPQLIAGPIVNFREVREQLKHRAVDFKGIEWGVTIFILGLSYKVLLANKIASLWNDVQTIGVLGINTPTAWLGSWGFSMQIFFDFFGYSLMAIGLGRIMGFNLPLNFLNPYTSISATDFWRRWHVTLGRWFREYVYIPLGGNRKGTGRMVFNTFVVWMLTGLWHGADWNFLLWGFFFFVILTLEKLCYLEQLKKHQTLGHIYMLILIPISWTMFNLSDLQELLCYLGRMFFIPLSGTVVVNGMGKFMELVYTYGWLLLICGICCTSLPLNLVKKYYKTWIGKLIFFMLFWFSVYEIAMGSNNPFLYFRF